MNANEHEMTVSITDSGQVVIPAGLRERFHFTPGSKAVVVATPDGILIKPVSRDAIDKLRGILPRQAGEPPATDELLAERERDRALEERALDDHST